jgi:branched-chain amino acid aminotransferase
VVGAFARGAAYVDGAIVPVDEAKISILDTGFSRSDVTYDVVGVWDGAFFRLDDHLDRFGRGCERLRLVPPLSRDEIAETLKAVVRASGLRESYVELICTRGIPVQGSRDPRTYENRFFAYAIPYVWILRPDDAEKGMAAVVARETRRIPTDSVDPTVKNFHWGDLTRGLFEAYDRGGQHPILLDHRDLVTEGPGYNIFALVGDELLTPASGTLEGITRRTVLELATEQGIVARPGDITVQDLGRASEVFATSTAGGVMPITSVDGSPVGDGTVGPTTRTIRERYWAAHADPRFVTVVDYEDS